MLQNTEQPIIFHAIIGNNNSVENVRLLHNTHKSPKGNQQIFQKTMKIEDEGKEERLNNHKKIPQNIIQHGNGHIAIHQGDGNIDNSSKDAAEARKLRAEIKLLKQIIEEKEECITRNITEYQLLIASKDEEIATLKETVEFLRQEITR